jgi:hypothetical protein
LTSQTTKAAQEPWYSIAESALKSFYLAHGDISDEEISEDEFLNSNLDHTSSTSPTAAENLLSLNLDSSGYVLESDKLESPSNLELYLSQPNSPAESLSEKVTFTKIENVFDPLPQTSTAVS